MATPILNSLTDNSARDGTGDVIEGAEIDANPNTVAKILDGTTETMLNEDTSASDGLRIRVPEITDISAAAGGIRTGLRLRHDPSSGTVGDNDGIEILLQGDDDGGNKTSFAEIETYFTDVSNGSEDADLVFKTMIGGTAREMLSIGSTGFIFNEDSQDLDFRIETDNIANGFASDAGLDTFAFGKAAVDDKFLSISTPAASHTATTDTYAFHVAPGGAQTIPSGTTALVASVAVEEPNITATGTVTSAATVYIKNAPTEGSSNYALWVDDGAVQIDSNLTVGGNITVTGGMTVAGANAFDIGDSDKLLLGDGDDLTVYHDGSNSYITNATGALKLATETSGIAITIGHGTSETTVADNLTVTGTTTATGGIELSHASANTLTASSGILSIEGVAIPTISSSDTLTNKTITSPTITGNTTFSDGAYNFTIASHDGTNGLVLGSTTVTSSAAELNILDGVTSTAAELNILDGVSSTAAELNILDGVTSTTAEINLIDGGTSRGTTAVASGDGLLINDGGTMLMTNVDTVSTYFASHSVGGSNIVTVGTVGTGTWQGTAVALAYGGTGLVSATDGKIVIADGSGAPVLLDVGSSTAITILGTVGTGTWQGTKVASAYLDDDTAHLGVVQTFTANKTFTGTVTVGVNGTGKDVIFYGDTASSNLTWDESADDLTFNNAGIAVGSDAEGDIYYRDSSGFLARLGKGSDGQVLTSTGTLPNWEASASGGAVSALNNATANELVTVGSTTTELDAESTLTFDGSTLTVTGTADVSGDFTAGTVNADADTAAGDNAAIGYTSAEGLILTGQGSLSDVTIKNDADTTVLSIPTGTTKVGIGTTAPATTLDVYIGASNDDNLTLSSTSGYNPKLVYHDVSTDKSAGIEFDSGSQALRFFNNSKTTERMRIDSAGKVGIGNTVPGTYANGNAALVVGVGGTSGSAVSEIVIAADDGGVSELNFTDTADTTNQGQFSYSHTLQVLTLNIGIARMAWDGGKCFLKETSNANMDTGLTINQADADDEILAFKSSDVAHGVTDYCETDTYARINKGIGTEGGISLWGLTEGAQALELLGIATTENTAKSAASSTSGCLFFRAFKANGTSVTSMGSDANLMIIKNLNATRFIFDAEGSGHADVEWTTYDDHDDMALLHDIEATMVPDTFGAAMKYDADALTKAGILGKDSLHSEKEGTTRGMINFTKLSMLHHGAIRQVHQQLQDVKEFYQDKIAALESRLMRLEA